MITILPRANQKEGHDDLYSDSPLKFKVDVAEGPLSSKSRNFDARFINKKLSNTSYAI